MNPLMSGMGQQKGQNLFSIIINLIFGFAIGLMVFLGFQEVLAYGSKLAIASHQSHWYATADGRVGFATTAAPYVVLAPVLGLVVKELTGRASDRFNYRSV